MHHRLAALDWMRGIVMILMATDHASAAFNAGRVFTDTVFFYDPSTPLDPIQFLFRWMSHLCAPTFLFLAGTSLALSIAKKKERGVPGTQIDRELLVRGLLIVGVDLLFINLFWVPGLLLLQVMYAIGGSMLLMIVIRRLPLPAIALFAIAVFLITEARLGSELGVAFEPSALWNSFLFSPARIDTSPEAIGTWSKLNPFGPGILTGYPLLPWAALMTLGWIFGGWLHRQNRSESAPIRMSATIGIFGLLLFGVLRGANQFGNLQLFRLDGSLVQWLHVSKYPPSLAFAGLELGIMGLILAGLFWFQNRQGERINENNPIRVFGQTAFFFYVTHILLLELASHALNMHKSTGLGQTLVACTLVCLVLYPVCLAYRNYKARHPGSVLRYF